MSDAPGGAESNADEAGALRLVSAEVPATPAVTMPSEVTAANGTWATPQTMSFQEEAEAAWRAMGVVVPSVEAGSGELVLDTAGRSRADWIGDSNAGPPTSESAPFHRPPTAWVRWRRADRTWSAASPADDGTAVMAEVSERAPSAAKPEMTPPTRDPMSPLGLVTPIVSTFPWEHLAPTTGFTISILDTKQFVDATNDNVPCILAGHGAAGSTGPMAPYMPAIGVDYADTIYGTDSSGFICNFQGVTLVQLGDTWTQPVLAGDAPDLSAAVHSLSGDNDMLGWTTDIPVAGGPSPVITVVYDKIQTAQGTAWKYAPAHVVADPSDPAKPSFTLGADATLTGAFATDTNLYSAFKGQADAYDGIHMVRWAKDAQNPTRYQELNPAVVPSFFTKLQWGPGVTQFFDAFLVVTFAKGNANTTIQTFDGVQIATTILQTPVYVLGRPSFWAMTESEGGPVIPESLSLFVLVFDATLLDLVDGPDQPEKVDYWFYVGHTADGKTPLWRKKSDLDPTAPPPGLKSLVGPNEIRVPNQMSVIYDDYLGLWLLLYGGRSPSTIPPQANPKFPMNGPFAGLYQAPYADDAVGVQLRVAESPAGPWSAAMLVWPSATGGIEPRSSVLYEPEATSPNRIKNSDQMTTAGFPATTQVRGAEYGVIFWPGAGEPVALLNDNDAPSGAIHKRFYFAMSTFNPYHVVLMQTIVTKTPTSWI